MSIGAQIRGWLAERVGMLDYWRRPSWRASWGGPFNGQELRQRLFAELCAKVPLAAVVETGTYRGTTTKFLHDTARVEVHSFETSRRQYGFARAHLRSRERVRLYLRDSRLGIPRLAASNVVPAGIVFFYLDAHGLDPRADGDSPLPQEIRLAFASWPDAIVMVDDFAVPDDSGYGFDDFGPGKALTLAYLEQNGVLAPAIWFPRCASAAETGARRGCVVLARDDEVIRLVDTVTTLRRWRGVATDEHG